MSARLRTLLIISFAALIGIALSVGIENRHKILFPLFTSGEPIPLDEDAAQIPGGIPFGEDGYFVVVQLDAKTFAIAEPKAWTRIFNYLIIGEDRAVLFDAGIGFYDIEPVVRALTDLPITFMASHFHYDHTGVKTDWERTAVVDLPHIRAQATGNTLPLSWEQHLSDAEGLPLITWQVTDWVAPGDTIDLGGRVLELLYTPGHTDNSISLVDRAAATMFTGDFISPNGISAITPTARMGDYLQATEIVLRATKTLPNIRLHAAHGPHDGSLPIVGRDDVQTLQTQLERIREGELEAEGIFPVSYLIKAPMVMKAEPSWLQDWDTTYPLD